MAPGETSPARKALEELERLLVKGTHRELAPAAERVLAAGLEALEVWRGAARSQEGPQAREECRAFEQHLARLSALVSHASQVQAGLQGLLSLLHESDTGSQYASTGATVLRPRPHRIVAEV